MTVLANLLPKEEVLQDLNISEESFESHLQKTNSKLLAIRKPKNEYSLLSLLHYLLEAEYYPMLLTKPKMTEQGLSLNYCILDIKDVLGEEDWSKYKDMVEEICSMYLNSVAEEWDGDCHVLSLNRLRDSETEKCYQYTFHCRDKSITYEFYIGQGFLHDKMIYDSFKILMELSFEAATSNRISSWADALGIDDTLKDELLNFIPRI